jgi:hypothetical protein
MKKVYMAMALAGALSAPTVQAAYDGTINIAASRPANAGGAYGGGAFTVAVTAGLGNVVGGNGLAGVLGTGYSAFCIEFNEHISLPGNYDANLNTQAVLGGGGPNPDPISRGTAWLYSQFRSGTLAANAPGYANTDAGNNSLQQAIWWLEQETSAFSGSAPAGSEVSFNNYLVAAAVAATGAGTAANARNIDANGEWGVMALNLFNGPPGGLGSNDQDMLAIVPEPTTLIAGALLLLPFGASTIRFMRKSRVA